MTGFIDNNLVVMNDELEGTSRTAKIFLYTSPDLCPLSELWVQFCCPHTGLCPGLDFGSQWTDHLSKCIPVSFGNEKIEFKKKDYYWTSALNVALVLQYIFKYVQADEACLILFCRHSWVCHRVEVKPSSCPVDKD